MDNNTKVRARNLLVCALSIAMVVGCKRRRTEEAASASEPLPPVPVKEEERDFGLWKLDLAYPDGRLYTCAYVLNARASDFIANAGQNNLDTFRRNRDDIVVATSRPVDPQAVADALEDIQREVAADGQGSSEGVEATAGSRLNGATQLYVRALQEIDKAGLSRRPNTFCPEPRQVADSLPNVEATASSAIPTQEYEEEVDGDLVDALRDPPPGGIPQADSMYIVAPLLRIASFALLRGGIALARLSRPLAKPLLKVGRGMLKIAHKVTPQSKKVITGGGKSFNRLRLSTEAERRTLKNAVIGIDKNMRLGAKKREFITPDWKGGTWADVGQGVVRGVLATVVNAPIAFAVTNQLNAQKEKDESKAAGAAKPAPASKPATTTVAAQAPGPRPAGQNVSATTVRPAAPIAAQAPTTYRRRTRYLPVLPGGFVAVPETQIIVPPMQNPGDVPEIREQRLAEAGALDGEGAANPTAANPTAASPTSANASTPGSSTLIASGSPTTTVEVPADRPDPSLPPEVPEAAYLTTAEIPIPVVAAQAVVASPQPNAGQGSAQGQAASGSAARTTINVTRTKQGREEAIKTILLQRPDLCEPYVRCLVYEGGVKACEARRCR